MRFKIFLPATLFLDTEIVKFNGESPAGSFCLLPNHIDYVTALTSGIASYQTKDGTEHFVAVDGGILVKQKKQVSVATRYAVTGELGYLRKETDKMLFQVDDHEKMVRSSVARLEAGFLRKFMEL